MKSKFFKDLLSKSAIVVALIVGFVSLFTPINAKANTIPTARLLEVGKTLKGEITYEEEENWYKVNITKPGRASFKFMSTTDQLRHVVVEIYDASNLDKRLENYQKHYNDSLGAVYFEFDADLTCGTYYINVRYYNGQYLAGCGPYDLTYVKFEDAKESIPDSGFGSNNTILKASQISLNKDYRGQLAWNDDRDMFKFTVNSKTKVNFNIKSSQIKKVYINFYDMKGNELYDDTFYWNDALGILSGNDSIELDAGTYVFDVQKSGWDYTGAYSFKLTSHTHNYNIPKIVKATPSSEGKIDWTCSCGKVSRTEKIASPKSIVFTKAELPYTGKVIKATFTVKDSAGKVIPAENYTVNYASGLKDVGKYKVTVTFKGSYYAGSLSSTYKIVPPATKFTAASGKSKSIKLKWKKLSKQVTCYQIQYSLNSNFKSARSYNVKKAKTNAVTINKLAGKKTYYVRIRAYKKTKSGTLYSEWSKPVKVKTKK